MMNLLRNDILLKQTNYRSYIKRSLIKIFDFSGITLLFLSVITSLGFVFWSGFAIIFTYYIAYIIVCFKESKYLIVKLEINENKICIEYLKYNDIKCVNIDLDLTKLELFDSTRGSLFSCHIVFKEKDNKLLTQYMTKDWTFETMKKVKEKIEFEKKQLMA